MKEGNGLFSPAVGCIIRLLWRINRFQTATMGVLTLVVGFGPAAYALAVAHIIGGLTARGLGKTAAIDAHVVFGGVVMLAVIFLLQQIAAPVLFTLATSLGSQLALLLRSHVMRATTDPLGLGHLEDAETANVIERAASLGMRTSEIINIVYTLPDWASSRLQGYATAALLFPFRLWAPFLVWLGWAPLPLWVRRVTVSAEKAIKAQTPSLRRAAYSKQLAMRPEAAKEIRIFGLEDWIIDRFGGQRAAGVAALWENRGGFGWMFALVMLLPLVTTSLMIFLLVHSTVHGGLGIPRFALYVMAVIGAKNIGHTGARWIRATRNMGAIPEAMALPERLATAGHLSAGTQSAADLPVREIRFEHVRFSYPGAAQAVFEDLNLTISAGKSVAIVGENGAGKTTLVKLLARFYDVQSGCIYIDGIDLRTLDQASWRSRLSVIFQDFIRYEVSVRDNVALGRDLDEPALARALEKAGADQLMADFPGGLDTVLSRAYTGGTDLSGGQWQRIALARTFAAVESGAGILVLDEPTANLDVRAEAELFDRFLELTQGLTTLLISHRMSTIHHADQICVIEHGCVVEMGSHNELMAVGGRYAEMFNVQARQFALEGEENEIA